jgi:hypothetical protein
MTSEMTNQTLDYASPIGPIVARPGRYFRNTRYIMTVVLIIYGGWSLYDGFINWPNWAVTHPKEKPYSKTDIGLNQLMGIALPPLGILLLARCLYLSRGVYRLDDDVLYVAGHPPVPIEAIVAIDRSLWDRKGIAFLDYDLSHSTRAQSADGQQSSAKGRIKLDDFIYDRDPTDEIFRAIEQSMTDRPAVAMQTAPAPQRPATTAQKIAAPQTITPAKPAAIQPAPARPSPVATKPATATQPTVSKPLAPASKPAPRPAAPGNPAAGPAKPAAGASPKPAGPPPTRMPPRPKMG